MTSGIVVRVLEPGELGTWDQFAASAPAGSPYATAEYLQALCGATGARFRIVAAFRGAEIAGGVPLYEVVGRFGPTVTPRLLLYYNGVVLGSHDSRYPSIRASRDVEVLSALESWLRGAGYARLVLKCRGVVSDVRPFLAAGWQVVPGYTYLVPLTDLTTQHGLVEQNLRRLIARCEREELALSDDDDFDAFFAFHEGTLVRKGADAYLPKSAFAEWFRCLHKAGRCRLYQARRPDGRSLAAQLVLTGAHRVSHTVAAGADPEFLRSGASAFLRWKSFQALAALGYEANDLTDAGLGPVTHFKSQFGGTLEPYFVLTRPDALPLRLADGAARLVSRLRRLR